MHIRDYLIDQSGLDWSELLSPWRRVLPAEFTLWMVNRFGDLFICLDDSSVWRLPMDEGVITRIANSRDQFASLVDQANNANDWFLIPLVDEMVANDVQLQTGQCYGFKVPPVIGGQYEVFNISPKKLGEYYAFLADFYDQISDLPDCTPVQLKILGK
jgi:hypothetical protein